MNGMTEFLTIIVSLLLGYIQGKKTKKKKIMQENVELKELNHRLANEVRRLKTIRYDYKKQKNAYKKKDANDLEQDIDLILKLDSSNLRYIKSFYVLMNHVINDEATRVTLSWLEEQLDDIEQNEDDAIEWYDIREDLNILFGQVINFDEYEVTVNELKTILDSFVNFDAPAFLSRGRDRKFSFKKTRRI